MIAQETNLELGEFSHYINDAHIYEDHIEGLKEQIQRTPYNLPTLNIKDKSFLICVIKELIANDSKYS